MNSVDNESAALDYCINKASPDGSNLYYATIFEPSRDKAIIISLHAFLHELSGIIHTCSDPGIARIKLAWWQEEIERLFRHQARHPITKQLHECIRLEPDLKTTFNSIIECFDRFVFIEQVKSLDAILSLYGATAGDIWQLCACQLHPTASASLKPMRDMGSIYQFIRCLQQPNTYINETRCIVPGNHIKQTELLNFRSETEKRKLNQAEAFSPLLFELKTRLDGIYQHLKENDADCFQHALIMNRLAVKTCDEILRDGCRLLDTNISLTPVRKVWIAWWTHFRLR